MTTSDPELKATPLRDLHLERGARMVPFAGYEMPVQYPAGIIAEHRWTREHAGLFDVSHMGQVVLRGPDAANALETLVPTDVAGLGLDRQRYGLFTTPDGGILDDLMISNLGDRLMLVLNAACKDQDLDHLVAHIGERCTVQPLPERALLALQGPAAAAVLADQVSGLEHMLFMHVRAAGLFDIDCLITRSGYSGEDGFEISVPITRAETLARALLTHPEVEAAGLGARDSLRLEAGLCLYGQDIDRTTTPVEAGLTWSIPKVRRRGGARAGGFPGAETILAQIPANTTRRRVGIRPDGRAPVRAGAELLDGHGAPVGIVTSGGFGPTIGAPVAMGYVDRPHTGIGTELGAMVRGKPLPVRVAALPFIEQRYYRG